MSASDQRAATARGWVQRSRSAGLEEAEFEPINPSQQRSAPRTHWAEGGTCEAVLQRRRIGVVGHICASYVRKARRWRKGTAHARKALLLRVCGRVAAVEVGAADPAVASHPAWTWPALCAPVWQVRACGPAHTTDTHARGKHTGNQNQRPNRRRSRSHVGWMSAPVHGRCGTAPVIAATVVRAACADSDARHLRIAVEARGAWS